MRQGINLKFLVIKFYENGGESLIDDFPNFRIKNLIFTGICCILFKIQFLNAFKAVRINCF